MKRKYSVNVGCRLDYNEHQKFLRIQKKNALDGDTAVIRFLINDYDNEDTDMRKIKTLLERIENSIENNQSDVGETAPSADNENKSNDSEATTAMLQILVALAKANPRVLAILKVDMPEIFNG